MTYNPSCEQDYDNRSDTMSSVDGSTTFRRGGWMRNSMPAMRSPPNVYDKVSGEIILRTLLCPYGNVAAIVNEALIKKKGLVRFSYWGPQPL